MKKNGHDRLGSQRWMCTDCNATRGVRHYRRRDRGELSAFLAWPFGPAAQPGPSRTFRRRTAGCWRIHPRLEPDGVVRHVLMADGTYLRHGRCLLTAIDGASGAVVAFRWCRHENTADYLALFEKIPAPNVLVCDGMRGIETAARSAWPSTRIQRCLVHVRRDCVNDLTHRPRLQAGRELKRLADALVTIREPDHAAHRSALPHDAIGFAGVD
ncbi:transposase [Bifidobacterium animalis subsp. animalis MCC 1489]|uniref:Transposase for IS3509a n=2 Tax=Bifidobacterium animalis TaxID=28025 RepID=A0AAV2W2V0_9BIFI|nr:transposase for IS3509a [Bifidobacterium animalis subsp. animalis ATCC 25527]AYN22902.1 transposase for IS3509a [Bifidobacterium animalis subsp. animalis]KFI42017.1 transposase for insertion sequence [Bifidobacterium animalis subsp. animalis]KOA63274.1 transposase [Bifidobacterium animalis subsp. animalis MCC 1489]CDI67082.1 Transposase for IS3509a [Bifidobacterium animalis subsp. animalis IM386]